MRRPRGLGVGALAERDFRLLFTATTITTIGDRLAVIALAFAVLDLGGATDLGIVLAARQGVQALVLLLGGVISDRLPRNLVLVGASLVQGAAQAATAALVLAGDASVVWLVALQALYGVGDGLVVPAETGLVPQTVSPGRLQQANALQGLTRNVTRVVGPVVGAAIVVAASPGIALAADAASFVVCALILLRIRIAPRAGGPERETFWRELRAGWREFTSRTWLWSAFSSTGWETSRGRPGACWGPSSRRAISAAPAPGERFSRRAAWAPSPAASSRFATGPSGRSPRRSRSPRSRRSSSRHSLRPRRCG